MLVISRADIAVAVDSEKELDAELLGESVVSLATAGLLEGQIGMEGTIVFPQGATVEQPRGVLQFDKDSELPYSTNALSSDVGLEGWNGTWVPRRSIHLVGVGQVGSMRVVQEAILGLDQFPFAVASAGKVKGSALDVYSVASLDVLNGGVSEDEKEPGNIVSNDPSAEAVELGTETKVTGDVRTSGRVSLSGGAVVDGEIREGQEAQNLPLIDLSVYDPADGEQSAPAFTAGMSEIKNGRVRHEGALTIGDLKLDSGLLYVNGPLTVTGKVTGNGAIVVRGPVTVTGQMNLESDLVALVAEGDVVVQGRGQEGSDGTRVQGLVYTKGSFKAQDSTIVGAVVSARVDGTTELDRVNMVQVPGVTDFEVVVDKELEIVARQPTRIERAGWVVGLEYQSRFIQFVPSNVPLLRELSKTLATLPEDQRGSFVIRGNDGSIVPKSQWGSCEQDVDHKLSTWNGYLQNVRDNTVEQNEIFKLDLNSFLSIQGELEVLLWKNYRQPVAEQQ